MELQLIISLNIEAAGAMIINNKIVDSIQPSDKVMIDNNSNNVDPRKPLDKERNIKRISVRKVFALAINYT